MISRDEGLISMWARLDQLGVVLLDASVSATLLLGAVTLAMLACRQPARRLLLARAALICLLGIIPAAGFGIVPKYDLLGALHSAGYLRHPLIQTRNLDRQSAPTAGPLLTAEADYLPAPATFFAGNRLSRALIALYFVGVGIGLGRFALGCGIVAVLKRNAIGPSTASLGLYGSLPYSEGRRKPRLRVASRIRHPVLVGFRYPLILIPPDLDRADASEDLRLALLHELAHAEGLDPWHGFFANLSHALWFFLPPIWWVWSRMRLDQEFVADHRATLRFGRPRDYADSLLKMAVRSSNDFASVAERASSPIDIQDFKIAPAERASPVYQRVTMLLRSPFRIESRPPMAWSLMAMLGVTVATLSASSLLVRPIQRDSPRHRVNTFRMARLDLEATPSNAKGRASSFDLPIRLPKTFDLTVDIWGDLDALSRSRVAGLCLQPVLPKTSESPAMGNPNWHKVHVKRDLKSVEVWIDGHLAPSKCEPLCTTGWLSVEPAPGLEGNYQNLTLTW